MNEYIAVFLAGFGAGSIINALVDNYFIRKERRLHKETIDKQHEFILRMQKKLKRRKDTVPISDYEEKANGGTDQAGPGGDEEGRPDPGRSD